MNSKIFDTIMSALHDYKKSWNDRRHIAGCGPAPQSVQESIDEIIEKTDETIQYLKETSFDNEKKAVKSLCEFMRFFQTELNIFGLDGNRIFLTDVQIRELHKIHNNDKVKVNWTRQSGKDTVILSYLVYLATKGKRILIDAPNIKQKEDMMKKLYCISNCVHQGKGLLKFQGGGYITTDPTTDPQGHCFDVLFANEYDYIQHYRASSYTWCNKFKKRIIVSKELNHPDFVESTINWNEVPGRDERFKQEMIKSIGLDAWYKEFEVTGMCEEFTASNLRNIKNEIQNKTDHKVIEGIRQECIKRTKCGSDHYLYKFGLSCGVQEYLVKRGFNIEHDYYYCGRKYTKISW